MDNHTTVLYSLELVGNKGFEDVVILLWRDWLILSFDHWPFKLIQFTMDTFQRSFHLVDNIVKVVNHIFRFSDKLIDFWRLPFIQTNSWLYLLVHQVDSPFHQWLLDVIKTSHDSVVVLNDQLQRDNLASICISLFV